MLIIVQPPTDQTFVDSIASRIRYHAKSCSGLAHMYVETAGGEKQSSRPLADGCYQTDLG